MALVNQDLVLDVVPGPIPQSLHLTEYDENMEVVVTLQQRGQPFQITTGTTVKIEGTLKGHPFSEDGTPSGNTVTFMVSKNMTAYSGRAWTKIKLTKDSKPVSTCGFWLDVDRAGVSADAVIGAPGFEEQIQEAVENYLDTEGVVFPTVSITPITGGNRVTFTDAEHPQGQSIDVMDGTSVMVDPTLTIAGDAADAEATGLRISGAEASIKAITEAGYEKTFALTPMHTDNNYKLLASGLAASASGYKVTEFYVNPGDIIHLKASADTEGVWHFQSLPTVSTKSTNNRVGETHTESINGFVVVPANANYLVISQASDNAYNEVTYARQFSTAQKADAMASLVVPAAVKAAIIYLLKKAAYTDPSLSAYKAEIDGWAETDNAIGSNMHGWTSGVQYTDLTLVENEYYKYSTGVINPETGSTRTGYVPCSGVKRLSLPRYRDNNNYYSQNWFFTADHAPISGFVFSKDGRTEVAVPSSAAYFGVSANDACLRQILGAGIIPYGE